MTEIDKKAIEEMAHDLCGRCQDGICVVDGKPCNLDLDCTCQINATTLYNAGYRKQSEGEWISIEERLPEPKKWVLVFTRHMNHPVVCFYEDVWYFLGGFFSKGQVTYWMPLPEPPDMKGV